MLDGDAPKKKEVDGGAWLLTYGDMVTLLMAFFVMMFAVSSVESDKFEAFLSGLAAFDNPAASEALSPVGDPVPTPPPPIGPIVPGATGSKDLAGRMAAALAAAEVEGVVELQVDKRGLVLIVSTDEVLFETGETTVTPRGREIIAALGPDLAAAPNDLIVEGHTDDVPLDRGGYTNWNLSTDRAVAVVNTLTRDHGVDPRRLEATGFGEWDPRDTGRTPEARTRNRRVEIVVLTVPEAAPSAGPAEGSLVGPTRAGGATDPVIGGEIRDPVGLSTIVPPIVRP